MVRSPTADSPDLGLVFGHHAPERHADSRQQFLRAERLGDVIVGAEVERVDLVRFGASRRQHDDRHCRRALECAGTPRCLRGRAVPDRARSDRAAARRPSSALPRRCPRCRRRSRATAGAAPPRAGWTPRRRRAGCAAGRSCAGRRRQPVSQAGAGTTIVNCAPPSGQFSAQIAARAPRRAVRGRSTGPCPCPRRAASPRRRDRTGRTGAAGRPARCPGHDRARESPVPRRSRSRRDVDRRARRRVLRGVLQQVRERRGGQARVESHGHVGIDRHLQRDATAACARPDRARPRRSPTDASSAASVAIAPASMRAMSRMFWNSRVRRSTSDRIRSLCSSRSSAASATTP